MLYVGVDQHKFSQVAVVNESGEVLENRRVYHDDKYVRTNNHSAVLACLYG